MFAGAFAEAKGPHKTTSLSVNPSVQE